MVITIFSYLSKDTVSWPGSNAERQKNIKIGGKAYYTGIALANLGETVIMFVPLSKKDTHLLDETKHDKVVVNPQYTSSTPCFENYFKDKFMSERIFKGTLNSFKFPLSLIEEQAHVLSSSAIIHFAPSKPEEISYKFISIIKQRYNVKISLDLDFFIKSCRQSTYRRTSNKNIKKLISLADYAILSEEDYIWLENSLKFTSNCELIVTLGAKGAKIYNRNTCINIPSVPVDKVVDTTGAGDTFMAAYLSARQNHTMTYSGNFAALIASHKIKSPKAYGVKI